MQRCVRSEARPLHTQKREIQKFIFVKNDKDGMWANLWMDEIQLTVYTSPRWTLDPKVLFFY